MGLISHLSNCSVTCLPDHFKTDVLTSPLGPQRVIWFLALNWRNQLSCMSIALSVAAFIQRPNRKWESDPSTVSMSLSNPRSWFPWDLNDEIYWLYVNYVGKTNCSVVSLNSITHLIKSTHFQLLKKIQCNDIFIWFGKLLIKLVLHSIGFLIHVIT